MSNLQNCISLKDATGKLDYRLTNDCMFHVVLDLKVMLNNDRILNFEVQVSNEKCWPERSLSYACRTFDQLLRGQPYTDVKPVYHIGFLDYDLEYLSPEFYATFKLLNVKKYELYSDKFVLSVINLNQIELATEEDRKYGIDHWARLFKADTWEAIKKMAQENEHVSDAAETLLQSNQDLKIRSYCEAVEEARRLRRGLELALEQAQAELRDKNDELQAQADEIARLKALLAEAEQKKED